MEIVYSCGQFYWLVHNTWEVECCVITATTKTKQKSPPGGSHDLIFLQCLLCGITGIKQLALILKAKAE